MPRSGCPFAWPAGHRWIAGVCPFYCLKASLPSVHKRLAGGLDDFFLRAAPCAGVWPRAACAGHSCRSSLLQRTALFRSSCTAGIAVCTRRALSRKPPCTVAANLNRVVHFLARGPRTGIDVAGDAGGRSLYYRSLLKRQLHSLRI